MTRRIFTAILPCAVALAAPLLGGCARAYYDHAQLVADVAAATEELRAEFESSEQLLSGFDPPEPGASWRVGDRILFGLHIVDDRGTAVRFIHAEVRSGVLAPDDHVLIDDRPSADDPAPEGRGVVRVPPLHPDGADRGKSMTPHTWSIPVQITDQQGVSHRLQRTSQSILLAIRIYDGEPNLLHACYAFAPEAFLRTGFHEACRTAVAAQRRAARRHDGDSVREADTPPRLASGDEAAQRPADEAHGVGDLANLLPALYALSDVIRRTPGLDQLTERLTPRPSLGSVILNAGVRPDFRVDLATISIEDRALPALAAQSIGYRIPIDLDLNGEPGLRCVLTVGKSLPPFNLCAGILGLDGAPAANPACRFVLRLLAARRGPSEARPDGPA